MHRLTCCNEQLVRPLPWSAWMNWQHCTKTRPKRVPRICFGSHEAGYTGPLPVYHFSWTESSSNSACDLSEWPTSRIMFVNMYRKVMTSAGFTIRTWFLYILRSCNIALSAGPTIHIHYIWINMGVQWWFVDVTWRVAACVQCIFDISLF